MKNNIASDLSLREYRLRHKTRPAWPLIQAEDILIVASPGKEGMLTIAARYTIHYFQATVLKRSFMEEYVDIRERTKG